MGGGVRLGSNPDECNGGCNYNNVPLCVRCGPSLNYFGRLFTDVSHGILSCSLKTDFHGLSSGPVLLRYILCIFSSHPEFSFRFSAVL